MQVYALTGMHMRLLDTHYFRQIRVGDSSAAGCGGTKRRPQLVLRVIDHLDGAGFGRPGTSLCQVPSVSGFVLINDACGDAPPVADRDPVVFRPGPDIAAALAA